MKKELLLLTLASLMASSFIMAQDLQLRYDRPPAFFEEALVIGNGTMGGIVYGGTDVDRISLNDITFWTGEPDNDDTKPSDLLKPRRIKAVKGRAGVDLVRSALDAEDYKLANEQQLNLEGHFSENYQPLGELRIKQNTEGEVTDYRRWLDLSDATAHTVYKRNGHEYRTDYFASHPDQGLVIRLTTNNPSGLDASFELSSQVKYELTRDADDYTMTGYAAYHSLPSYHQMEQNFWYDEQRGIHFCTRMKVIRKSPQELLLCITNATSFNGFDKDPVREGREYKAIAERQIANLATRTYDDLLSRHTADYKAIFDRVKLTLGNQQQSAATTDQQLLSYLDENQFNPNLEALYFQFGRYLLISCSRTEGVPANLQGLWNESMLPPWSSNYTCNINLEENYWPAETANMPEMHMALLSFLKGLQDSGERTAKEYYDVQRGWCLAHNSDIWAMTNPVGRNAGSPSWACWNMGGAWLSTHIWEHYTFSLDKTFLADYYPVLKGAAEFCLGWLIEKDGVLMTSPSTSPENVFVTPDGYHGATCYGGSADIAMIRECLTSARNAALELGSDKQFVAEIDRTLARLMPYKIGHRGNLQEWYHDWDDELWDHRHQSHLLGLYPGNNLADGHNSIDALKKAAARTLEIKGDKTTGWSTGWRVNLFARLGDADDAYHIYRKLLSYVSPDGYRGNDARRGGGTYPNLLDAHSPFQIDGNFGGCAGVVEMLLQSTYANPKAGITGADGLSLPTLTLLPALPKNWSNGSVSGLRARGGLTVSMTWTDSRVSTLTITAPQSCKISLREGTRTRTIKLKKGDNHIAL